MLVNPFVFTPLLRGATKRSQYGSRIIKRGFRLSRGKLKPAELHATKGWRFVPK